MNTQPPFFFEDDPMADTSPEFLEYLQKNPETDRNSILELPHVPVLIGGMKSSRFVIQGSEASPDASPEEGITVDLSEAQVAVGGMRAFAEVFQSIEYQADAQYPAALFEAQQHITHAEAQNQKVTTLFVPGIVNHTAKEYFRRLQRLSQDTGLKVATCLSMRQQDNYFKEYLPPQASSIDAYWEAQARETARKSYVLETPTKQQGVELITHISTYGVPRGGSQHENVRPLSRIPTEDLRTLFDTPKGRVARRMAQGAREHIKTAAYELDEYQIRDYHKAAARKILAKLNDPEGLAILQHEFKTKTGGFGSESLLAEPLGIYMSHDRSLLEKNIRAFKDMAETGSEEDPYAPTHIATMLRYSLEPVVGPVLSNYLRSGGGYEVIAVYRCLPDYVANLQALPQTADRQASLDIVRKDVARHLAEVTATREQRIQQGTSDTGHASHLANMLFSLDRGEFQGVLRRHVLALFAEGGHIVEDNSYDFSAKDFCKAYLRYREKYGDLPEISQHIRIVSDEA